MKIKTGGTRGTTGLVALLFVNFAAYGNVMTIFGATVPRMRESFGWSYTTTGLVLAASAVTFFLSTFASGFLLQKVRPQLLLIAGLGLGAVSLGLFARWPTPALNIVLNLSVGIYMGIIEVITNFEALRLETGGKSRLMNLLHAGFSLGAILGPLAVGLILRLDGPWQVIYPASGGLLLLMAVLFLLFPFPDYAGGGEAAPGPAPSGLRLAREPLLVLLTLGIILYVGSELGVTNWSAEYFFRALGAQPSTAAFAVSALWIGILAGRLLLSLAYHGTRQDIVLLALSLVCAACLFSFLAVKNGITGLIVTVILGLGYSGIYPMIISLTGREFRSSAAVGIVTTGAGLGSFSFPFLFSAIAQAVGLRTGFVMLAVLPLGISVVAIVLIARAAARAIRARPG
jgi:fucose permease